MAGEKRRAEITEELQRGMRRMGIEAVLFNQSIADRLGVNLTDFLCFNLLLQEGAMTAGRLAELMGLTTGAVTGIIDRLEKASLAERAADPNDRRRVMIQPLSIRAPEVQHLIQALLHPMGELYATYSEAELERLLGFVKQSGGVMEGARLRMREKPAASEAKTAAGEKSRLITAPIKGVATARLVFGHGAANVLLQSARDLSTLFHAQFEGPQPKLDVEDGVVTVRYSRPTLAEAARLILGGAKHSAVLTLTGKVPWELEIRGGLSRFAGDLSGTSVSGVHVTGGASDIELTLPAPSGTVPVRISGGAHKVVLHRPAGSTARIQVLGGAHQLRFDAQHFSSVGGDVMLESGGFKTATDRYDIRFTGGASSLTVDTRP
jgi:DNA-binding MarR family transcriptional regulator